MNLNDVLRRGYGLADGIDPTWSRVRLAQELAAWVEEHHDSDEFAFEAFEVARGLYWYCVLWYDGMGDPLYAIQCNLGYSPGMSESEPDSSEGLAFEVYSALVGDDETEEWGSDGALTPSGRAPQWDDEPWERAVRRAGRARHPNGAPGLLGWVYDDEQSARRRREAYPAKGSLP